MGYDLKYGQVTTEHGDIPADEPVIVFRARDRHLPAVLAYYHMLCMLHASPMRHLRLIAETTRGVQGWQDDNHDKVRTPDSERSRAWMRETA